MSHPTAVNPLLPAAAPPPPPPERAEPSPALGEDLAATYGPSSPLGTPAPTGPGLPSVPVTTDPLLWVVGVHGGAGASTVAALLDSAGQHAGDVVELPQRLPASVAPMLSRRSCAAPAASPSASSPSVEPMCERTPIIASR